MGKKINIQKPQDTNLIQAIVEQPPIVGDEPTANEGREKQGFSRRFNLVKWQVTVAVPLHLAKQLWTNW
jgi:hypothetical protein